MRQPPEAAARPLQDLEAAYEAVTLPMTRPLDPDRCPCGRPPRIDGFCEQHAGAVAFKVPVSPDGEVLPAFGWQWSHADPCPLGKSWRIESPNVDDSQDPRPWACPHSSH